MNNFDMINLYLKGDDTPANSNPHRLERARRYILLIYKMNNLFTLFFFQVKLYPTFDLTPVRIMPELQTHIHHPPWQPH